MKVYSWNILYKNKQFPRALEFIRNLDFDVLALQEVPEPFLEELRALPFHIAYDIDADRLFPHGLSRNYLVVLSRYPIEHQVSVPMEAYPIPLRTRAALALLRLIGFTMIANKHGFAVDVAHDSGKIRVFNLHLTLSHPRQRLIEFERAMAERGTLPTIVCGDFNILESLRVTSLNWILAGKVRDALQHRRERTTIEKRFIEHELVNPHRGQITHPFSRSQLDHILVSKHFTVADARVLPDPVGSDHHPIAVDVTLGESTQL